MDFDTPVACPRCRHVGPFDHFGILGADDSNVFCPCCQASFEPKPLPLVDLMVPDLLTPATEPPVPIQKSLFD
ncbi:MAG: hypothetical protein IT428_17520 [Planctomycetaceae bacterium]|nr:hypothetical protein [Planctomycetaceae bacterium]